MSLRQIIRPGEDSRHRTPAVHRAKSFSPMPVAAAGLRLWRCTQTTSHEFAVCVIGGEIVMNAKHRVITTTLSAAIAGILFVPAASACGYPTQPQSSLTTQQLRLDPQNPLHLLVDSMRRGLRTILETHEHRHFGPGRGAIEVDR